MFCTVLRLRVRINLYYDLVAPTCDRCVLYPSALVSCKVNVIYRRHKIGPNTYIDSKSKIICTSR